MKYSLRQLAIFLAVAHYENITRAAESLFMSQSAASSALKELEQQYGIQLFDRIGKRLQLNQLGRVLRPKVEALLSQAQALEGAFLQHQELGSLRVGATLTIGNYMAIGIMAAYMDEQAGSKVALDVANTATIVEKVENFELDIGLIEGELSHNELEIIPWRQDELIVFCHPDHPLARQAVLSDEHLLTIDWVVREPGSGTRQGFERAMTGLLPQLTIALELQHTEAIKRAVEANLGVGCLSGIALNDAMKRGSFVPLAVPHRQWLRHFYFILHPHKYRSEGVNRWISLCQDAH